MKWVKKELIIKLFKPWALSSKSDDTEDNLIHYFQDGQPCSAGSKLLTEHLNHKWIHETIIHTIQILWWIERFRTVVFLSPPIPTSKWQRWRKPDWSKRRWRWVYKHWLKTYFLTGLEFSFWEFAVRPVNEIDFDISKFQELLQLFCFRYSSFPDMNKFVTFILWNCLILSSMNTIDIHQ